MFMPHTFKLPRRSFLAASSSAAALAALPTWSIPISAQTNNDSINNSSVKGLSINGLKLGQATPFSFDALIAQAKNMAASAYTPPPEVPHNILERIGYAEHGQIRFKTDNALFKDDTQAYPITFFPMGSYFQTPVHMHVLQSQVNTSSMLASEILYEPVYFDMPADSPAHELTQNANIGFAGFRLQESQYADQNKFNWHTNDWAAFLGASYFRTIGELYQYGLSARGIAINTAVSGAQEEFPAFTHFYFAPQSNTSDQVTIYALLDGPSVAGAYKFTLQRGKQVVMDIEAHLFLRKDVERLGIAPMTSMYWFSETNKAAGVKEWRPEVHDSDGLAIWTGSGEHIWRPLNNPEHTTVSAFADNHPRGFGLLQRDRVFDHYLDGVAYDRRPSLWVEPLENWGQGSVELVEIPTHDETQDNIVAFWTPEQKAKAGNAYALRYRLHWGTQEPNLASEPKQPTTALARCVATRTGMGGQPGEFKRQENNQKFIVEFLGENLAILPSGVKPQAELWASRGQFTQVFTEPIPDDIPGHWRTQFDFVDHSQDPSPVEMRLFLKLDDQTLSETWLYQYNKAP